MPRYQNRGFIGVGIPGDAYDAIKAYAEREDRSIAQVVRWSIEDWLMKHTPWRPAGRQETTVFPGGARRKRPLANVGTVSEE